MVKLALTTTAPAKEAPSAKPKKADKPVTKPKVKKAPAAPAPTPAELKPTQTASPATHTASRTGVRQGDR
jgi:hypothetical protein